MKKNIPMLYPKIGALVLLTSLIVLPGCALVDWFKGKNGGEQSSSAAEATPKAGDAVLVTMDGKPVITESMLQEKFNQVLEDNPQLKAILPLMPNAKQDLLNAMVSEAIINKYAAQKGIENNPQYQKELACMIESVKSMLKSKYFAVDHPVTVSDAEVKKFYEENKAAMPDLLLSHGGVKAVGIVFDNEADAKAFAEKAKAGFSKAAADANLKDKITDFKFVNNQSLGIDAALRCKIAAVKKTPAIEVVKDSSGKFWVVHATEVESAKYRPFEQVQAGIKQYVEKEKRVDDLKNQINKLKKEYNVVVNEDYFKKQEEPAAGDQSELLMPEEPMENAKMQKIAPKSARSA